MEGIEFRQGDCLVGLDRIETGTVDAVITDPPYCSGAITESGKGGALSQGVKISAAARNKWFAGDNMATAGYQWIMRMIGVQAKRILRPSGSLMIFSDWRMVPVLAPAIESAGLRFQNLIVWHKGIGLGTGFRSAHELILYFTAGAPKYFSHSVANVIEARRVPPAKRINPTQKPVQLMRDIISVTTPEKGLVVDPFAGSGTTAVACADLGRRCISFEIDKRQCDKARERVEYRLQ